MSFTAGAGTRFLLSTDSSGTISPSGPLSIAGGTATANTPVLSATQTWNNAAVTFTGWRLNVTDTASNAASLLLDLQVGGTSRLSLRKDGRLIFGAFNQSSTLIQFGFDGYGLASDNNGAVVFVQNNQARASVSGWIVKVGNSGSFQWSSTDLITGTTDLVLFRDAANTLAQRNGVNAQTFRVYNTFTDASNYERGKIEWASNVLRIGTEKAGTGTARGLEFQTDGTTRWVIAASSNNLTSDMGGAGVVGFEGGSVFTASGAVFKSRGIAYLDSTTGAVNLRPGSVTALSATSSGILVTGYTEMSEQTAPAAPATNSVRIYAEDNGSGKTRLMARFATGAAQQIAIEP